MPNTAILRRVGQLSDVNLEIWKLNKLISKNPEDLDALKELASIYHYLHENRIAIRLYEKILSLDPKDGVTKVFLGYLYYEIGNLDRAIDELNDSLDMRPHDSFAYFLVGNAYSRSGLIKEAVRSYDMALMLGFDVYRAHMDFATKFEDMNRKYKALREYKAAYEIGPKSIQLMQKIQELELEISNEKKVL